MATVEISEYCDVNEAARIIGCTDARVRQMLIAKELAGRKFYGRAWIVEIRDAERVRDTEHTRGAKRTNPPQKRRRRA